VDQWLLIVGRLLAQSACCKCVLTVQRYALRFCKRVEPIAVRQGACQARFR